MKRLVLGVIAAAIAVFAAIVWNRDSARIAEPLGVNPPLLAADTTTDEPILPLPRVTALDPQIAALGRDLFHDLRLSGNNTVSCASCHSLALAGTDHRPMSFGVGGAIGTVNAPTVLNSGFNFRQFWNGRAATLENQIDGPTQAPAEMASSWPQILAKLRRDSRYVKAFRAHYRDGVTADNVRNAIATYERSLVTPSRFDRFLRGDRAAITARERAGYEIFKQYGCASCHQGVNVGGNMYQVFGVMDDYFAHRGNMKDADLGRYAVTHDERDRHVFKVPSLRNVAQTAPYFHDGSAATLPLAVRVMGWYQLGRALTDEEIDLLVGFLTTLDGTLPTDALPASAVGAHRP